jgi:hypothetical protein
MATRLTELGEQERGVHQESAHSAKGPNNQAHSPNSILDKSCKIGK